MSFSPSSSSFLYAHQAKQRRKRVLALPVGPSSAPFMMVGLVFVTLLVRPSVRPSVCTGSFFLFGRPE